MSNYLMVPSRTVKSDLITKNEQIVYIPIATRETYGSVKIGDGLTIHNGVISFDESQITLKTISKNGVYITPDENKNIDIVLSKSDVGLENVDNTSDLDKPISLLQQTEFDKKVNIFQGTTNVGKSLVVDASGKLILKEIDITLDKDVLFDLGVQVTGDNFNIVKQQLNLKSLNETQSILNLPLVNDTTAGLMSIADYKSIRDLQARVGQLENKTTRLLYSNNLYPTAEEINAFVTGLGYITPFDGIAVIIDGTNHIWHYYENDNIGWKDDGLDVVSMFTNDVAGIIRGSAIDGKVYAETDGTGSVYGWDVLKNLVHSKVNQSDFDTFVYDVGEYLGNIESSNKELNNSIVNINTTINNTQTDVNNLKNQVTLQSSQIEELATAYGGVIDLVWQHKALLDDTIDRVSVLEETISESDDVVNTALEKILGV